VQLFYLVFLILFPFNCDATESQIEVFGTRYALDESDQLFFSDIWKIGYFTQAEIDSDAKEILSPPDNNLKFLKTKLKNSSQKGAFCYMYFWPDLVQKRKKNQSYHLLQACALDPQEFPTEKTLKEVFEEEVKKEKSFGMPLKNIFTDLFSTLLSCLFNYFF
jgi:hypothetical protein